MVRVGYPTCQVDEAPQIINKSIIIIFLHLAACRLSQTLFRFDSGNRHTNATESISMPHMVKTGVGDNVFSFQIGIESLGPIKKKKFYKNWT